MEIPPIHLGQAQLKSQDVFIYAANKMGVCCNNDHLVETP